MNNFERLEKYLKERKGPNAVIFDIGTRAARILVGPKVVPTDDWSKSLFFNEGILTNLGAEVNRYEKVISLDSSGLIKLIDWINRYKYFLNKYGVDKNDIIAVGTAVFRWMKNSKEVISHIQDQTGINLKTLEDSEEAQYSMFSLLICHKFKRGKCTPPKIKRGDVLLLLDQGGGSMEVSFAIMGSDDGQLESFDEFGTIALRNKFLSDGPDGKIDPGSNRRQIKKQNERIIEYIENRVDQWEGFSKIKDQNIHVYAMGSAATNVLKNLNNYEMHNKILTKEALLQLVEQNCSKIQDSQQQVRTLYKNLQKSKSKNQKDKMDTILVSLYGLPVYIKMMEKFGVKEMRIAGYGLRYGVYVAKNYYNVSF